MSERDETTRDDTPKPGSDGADGEAGVAVWRSDAWRARAIGWLDARLAEHGIERTGATEQPHLRPWATALRAPTSHGPFWLKAAAPGTAFEIRLYRLLAQLAPGQVLEPLASDEERAWIVLPDGGPTLGDGAAGEALVVGLERALPQYARLQRALAPHADELLRLGVVDMRPSVMPQRFDQALAAVEPIVAREGRAEDRATFERAAAMQSTFAGWCRELAKSPVPPSLDHNDLHPWNIFATPEGEHARFYDWGDSVLAHPFASLLVALGFVRWILKVAGDDARIERIRDAYLAEFSDVAPRDELVSLSRIACHVAKIARVLTWTRALATLSPEEADDLHEAPLKWLGALLDPSYIIVGG